MRRRTTDHMLFEAAKAGDLNKVQALVIREEKMDGEDRGGESLLNTVDYIGRTVLHHAATEGQGEVVQWLLADHGGRSFGFTKILARNRCKETALHGAVQNGHLETCKAIVKGCKVENGERQQILNAAGDDGCTLLNIAASNGHERIIRWLLSDKEGGSFHGFNKSLARDHYGGTVLHIAAMCGNLACCRAIVEGCKVENGEREQMLNAVTKYGKTVLHVAAISRRDEVIRWVLSNEEGGGRSLGFASDSVTALNKESESALHDAVFSGSVASIEALLSGCTAGERIKLFLAVDTNYGWTPLHQGVQCRQAGSIRELLRWEEAKMIVDARDNRGMTALHRLACNGGLDEESRKEWRMSTFFLLPLEDTVSALLGLSPQTAAAAFVDVNARLEIPEEVKAATT